MPDESVVALESASSSLFLRPVAGRIGVEVRGIRLAEDLDDATIDAIRAALLRHKVVFFRDQSDLDDVTHEAFAMRLGELAVPSEQVGQQTREGTKAILELDSKYGAIANSWHTDLTFLESPPAISILRALTVPDNGGDTIWVNMATAYQDLPEPLRELADKLRTIHTSEANYIMSDENRVRLINPDSDRGRQSMGASFGKLSETEQPMVRVHPETGERSLLLGRYATRICGLRPEDASYLLNMFQDYALRPENTVRWTWRAGDVAMWDNRSTQHRVVADFGDERRLMRRVTLLGEPCVGLDGRSSRPLRSETIAEAAE